MKRAFAVLALWALAAGPAQSANWPAFGFDPGRSSYNPNEKTITESNVAHLRVRWQIALGAVADSTPIYLSRVVISSQQTPVLFQTTRTGTTVAVNALSGKILWRFATHGPKITTSTPVADPSAGVLFVPGVDGYVHELSTATGSEIQGHGFPLQITRIPHTEEDASPLNLANGHLYAATSGYNGDAPPYDGHVVSLNLSDGKVRVFNSLCSNLRTLPTSSSCPAQRSGIWARGGVVADPDAGMKGRVYATTGNGEFDAAKGGKDYGDSILSLTPSLSLADYYTPSDYARLDDDDLDLGSSAPAMLPVQTNSATPLMMVQGGKDYRLRLIDRTHLGELKGQLQTIALPDGLFSAPAVWNDPSGKTRFYVGFPNELQAYSIETTSSGTSRIHKGWSAQLSGSSTEGTSPVIAGGMVFVATGGAVEAFDAVRGTPLWSSAQTSSGGTIGSIHWQSPIVVDGSVYCSDQSGNLTAFSLPQSSVLRFPRSAKHRQ